MMRLQTTGTALLALLSLALPATADTFDSVLTVGVDPQVLVVPEAGDVAYVASDTDNNYGGDRLIAVDPTNGAQLRSLDLGYPTLRMAVASDGSVLTVVEEFTRHRAPVRRADLPTAGQRRGHERHEPGDRLRAGCPR